MPFVVKRHDDKLSFAFDKELELHEDIETFPFLFPPTIVIADRLRHSCHTMMSKASTRRFLPGRLLHLARQQDSSRCFSRFSMFDDLLLPLMLIIGAAKSQL